MQASNSKSIGRYGIILEYTQVFLVFRIEVLSRLASPCYPTEDVAEGEG
jgi:hypothetical protein